MRLDGGESTLLFPAAGSGVCGVYWITSTEFGEV